MSGRRTDNRPPTASMAAPVDTYQVPRTPLESRQGYHPKTDDRLLWKSPPSRQLSRQKRVEYESDVRERFYDDYMGNRSTGDARNEVLTTSELAKLKFDPNLYRVNAYQGLAYDPMRQVPSGLDFNAVLQQEKAKERQRQVQGHRQRRMSDSTIGSRANYYQDQHKYQEPSQQWHGSGSGSTVLPPLRTGPSVGPRSALQDMGEVINPEIVPAMEDWLSNASTKDQEVAADFFRTMSSHGQRPNPATKAALHRSRVRSAVMTPSRKNRQEQMAAQNTFQQLSRETAKMEKHVRPVSRRGEQQQQLRRTNSEKMTNTGGSMFAAKREPSSHFTIHQGWASESVGQSKKK